MSSLVIGIGNPLRRDDGVGGRAADALAAEGRAAQALHQLLPELAPVLASVGRVVFVDAARASDPGEIRVERAAPSARAAASHSLAIGDLLALVERLAGRAPEAWVVSVGAADLGIGEGLSAPVAARFEALLAAVRALLDEEAGADEARAAGCEVPCGA